MKKRLNKDDNRLFTVVINPRKKDNFFREAAKLGNFNVKPAPKNRFVSLNCMIFTLEILEKKEDVEEIRNQLDELQIKFLH